MCSLLRKILKMLLRNSSRIPCLLAQIYKVSTSCSAASQPTLKADTRRGEVQSAGSPHTFQGFIHPTKPKSCLKQSDSHKHIPTDRQGPFFTKSK